MRADLLLEHFELLVKTPQDTAGLQAAILELSMRGQLVPQDPTDEPASELLVQIEAERSRLVEQGKHPKPKSRAPIYPNEIPYGLPTGWVWARLGDVSQVIGGGTPATKVQEYWSEDGIPWLTPADLYRLQTKTIARGRRDISARGLEKSSARLLPGGSVLFSSRAPIGYVAIAANQLATNQGFKSCVPYIMAMSEYLYYFLRQAAPEIDRLASGTTFREVSGKDLSLVLLPLPPLAEQKRIVARVDELLAQTRALAAQLEATDEALVPAARASFQALADAKDTAAQREAWQRISDAFDALTADPRTLDALKQTVLQLAVQGKLVPQDPHDEPASALLEDIREEQQRLVLEGKIPRLLTLPPIKSDEMLFELPHSWVWCRTSDLCLSISDGDHQPPPKVESGIPFLVISNIRTGEIDFSSVTRFVPEAYYADIQEMRQPRRGDILYSIVGSLGIPVLVETDREFCFQRHIALFRPMNQIDRHYLYLLLVSPTVLKQGRAFATGIAQLTIPLSGLRKIVIPLPPLPEQKRIVAKVQSLLALIDALGAEAVVAEEVRGRLLKAVLNGD
jgi:type I restriction enzyme S subunit